jgi:uncharacterized repeat protein (TIGR01451 family)
MRSENASDSKNEAQRQTCACRTTLLDWLARVFAVLFPLLLAAPASAQIAFTLRTGNASGNVQSMPVDSNKCGTDGPRAMYVGGTITNSSASVVSNINATISGLSNGFFLAGGQGASQAVGSLGSGQSTGVYWFIGYGCTIGATSSPIIAITSNGGAAFTTINLTGRSAISANAGGNVLSSTLGPGAVVGQTIYFDAAYDFGGSSANDEFFLQPSGGQNFNAACFRLVGSQVTGSNISAIPSGTTNQLYFRQAVQQSGNGYFANVRYSFEYQCANAATTARPYAVQTSGNTNIKYTGNFDGAGSISLSFPGATNPFTISKTANLPSAPAGNSTTVKYTVTVTNPSAYSSRISKFVDTLPEGASFLALDSASGVTSSNSSSVPSPGATGTVTFEGRQDQSYLIPANGSVSLIYSVSMPPNQGTYTNSAQAYFGTATTQVTSATFTVTPPPPLSVTKSSAPFYDPINNLVNPKFIPGGYAAYTVVVNNPNAYSVASNSIVVVDATPPNLRLYVNNVPGGSGPVYFADGSTPSGLSYAYSGLNSTADDVDFSNNGGASWDYIPTPDNSGVDANVTHLRIRPRGVMAAGTSFSVRFGYLIP